MKTKAKSAFTLLEMLVVIGIIGVLMGVIVSQFGGATESAKAAKCETNMRNLATAAHACALEQKDGYFPPASSFSYFYVDHQTAKVVYHNRIGWISGAEDRPGVSKNRIPFQPIPFNSDDDNAIRRALTNGVMWRAMGSSRAAYQCPVHAEAVRKATGRMPGWSYAMNKNFGYDKGEKTRFWGKTKDDSAASKTLMFAELQAMKIDKNGDVEKGKPAADVNSGGSKSDAVLDYDTETIGFNHQLGKRHACGHVAFEDGHVERMFYPLSGISLQELTKALCAGKEIQIVKGGYDLAK